MTDFPPLRGSKPAREPVVGCYREVHPDISTAEMKMDQYENNLAKVIDRTLTARYGLWSAMLTAHSVFLSVAVALASLSTGTATWQVQFVAYAAIVSVLVISTCFISSKAQYEDIGKRLAHYEEERPEAKLMQDVRNSSTRCKAIKGLETLAVVCLNVEAMLLLSVILT